MASWVEAGPGSRLQAAMPSVNSSSDSQPRRCTHNRRSSAMWAGGPPKPMVPIHSHWPAIVVSGTITPPGCG
jgi:hypothetical protein